MTTTTSREAVQLKTKRTHFRGCLQQDQTLRQETAYDIWFIQPTQCFGLVSLVSERLHMTCLVEEETLAIEQTRLR